MNVSAPDGLHLAVRPYSGLPETGPIEAADFSLQTLDVSLVSGPFKTGFIEAYKAYE
jgi:hypothetical protein